jgi:hypothetical protein
MTGTTTASNARPGRPDARGWVVALGRAARSGRRRCTMWGRAGQPGFPGEGDLDFETAGQQEQPVDRGARGQVPVVLGVEVMTEPRAVQRSGASSGRRDSPRASAPGCTRPCPKPSTRAGPHCSRSPRTSGAKTSTPGSATSTPARTATRQTAPSSTRCSCTFETQPDGTVAMRVSGRGGIGVAGSASIRNAVVVTASIH